MDKPKDGDEFYPMIAVNVGPLTNHNAIMLQIQWAKLESMEKLSTPPIGLTREQANDFIGLISRALAKLDAFQATGEELTRQ